ncbi:hypothetical protein [Martelella alba]|uniref:Uncharacterized protein n=1 Tax=Martelella alba TaxID=2590451 RepID=A0ABY2SKX9_9HYPH|nr:hypothetical protein [Martelella alba]TKI06292.1 hypothetical protein FCN80_10650 [Martelella alba]
MEISKQVASRNSTLLTYFQPRRPRKKIKNSGLDFLKEIRKIKNSKSRPSRPVAFPKIWFLPHILFRLLLSTHFILLPILKSLSYVHNSLHPAIGDALNSTTYIPPLLDASMPSIYGPFVRDNISDVVLLNHTRHLR